MNEKEIDIDYRCYANSHLPRHYIVSRIEYDFESGGWYSQVDVAKLEKNKQVIKYGTLADAKKHAKSIYMQYKDKYGVDMRIVISDELIDIDSLNKNINKLERQLAEKDKEITRLKAQVEFYKSYYTSFNEKVIEELEKVKDSILDTNNGYWHFGETPYMPVEELSDCLKEYIDDKTKELKGE